MYLTFLKRAALVTGLAMLGAPVYGATESVVCDGAGDSADIKAALDILQASGDPSNTLNLSGTCALTAPVEVRSFSNVTIQGVLGTPALLSAPNFTCGTAATPGSYAGTMLSVIDTRTLNLRFVEIHNGGGVLIQDSSANFTGVTVNHSRGEGVNLQGASTLGLSGSTIVGPSPGTPTPAPNHIINSCNNGLVVGAGSTASMFAFGSIDGNGGSGVVVSNGVFSANGCCMGTSTGTLTPGSVSINNNRIGISIGLSGGTATVSGGSGCNASSGVNGVATMNNNREFAAVLQGPSFFGVSGQATISGNQSAPESGFALAYRSGIYAGYGSRVFISPGAVIQSTAGGPGIWADMQSLVRLGSLPAPPPPPAICPTPAPALPNAQITGNGAEGLRLTKMSAADGQSVVNISGNTGNDATCDATSYLFGINSGINKNKCSSK